MLPSKADGSTRISCARRKVGLREPASLTTAGFARKPGPRRLFRLLSVLALLLGPLSPFTASLVVADWR